jgi:ABC-type dipeptide/oligopeptide/nickel transport system permease subunit
LAYALLCWHYILAPDATPDANRIIVEIAAKKPGYKQQFLQLKKDVGQTSVSDYFFGREDEVQYIPINSYKQIGDSLFVEKFVDDGVTEPMKFALHGEQASKIISNKTFWLGTDKFGRDILSRLIVGVRVSLGVGLIAVAISLTVGIFLGAVAGYFRGWIDEAILWLINVVWSIPTLLLVFAITLALGKGFWQVFIAVGLTLWVNVARLVRGQVLSIRELNYIEATKAMGFSHARTIFKHILPNIMGPVIVIAASNFASAIVIEAGLSFLGVGVQAPQPSWGLMIKENYNFIITNNPMLAIAPGIAIMLLVLAFNLLGNGLRDVLDVRS